MLGFPVLMMDGRRWKDGSLAQPVNAGDQSNKAQEQSVEKNTVFLWMIEDMTYQRETSRGLKGFGATRDSL